MGTAYSVRIPEDVMTLVSLRAKGEHVDKTTALKQLLHMGSEEYVVELYQKGEISVGKAAELLGKSVYEIYELLKRHCVEIGALKEQRDRSREHAKILFGKKASG